MWCLLLFSGIQQWGSRLQHSFDCHVQVISDTSTKICVHFKMISISISYELIHVCSLRPRTPTPQTFIFKSCIRSADSQKMDPEELKKRFASGDFKVVNNTTTKLGAGRTSVTIYSRSARVQNVICATVSSDAVFSMAGTGGCMFAKYDWLRAMLCHSSATAAEFYSSLCVNFHWRCVLSHSHTMFY